VTVLEIPPVDSPETAVKMSIYSDIKKGKLLKNQRLLWENKIQAKVPPSGISRN
jgi:hypothetical protein